jgi:hypothetical protein
MTLDALKSVDYPALYQSASSSSKQAQHQYLWSVRIEYALLIVASCASLFVGQFPNLNFLYSISILIASGIMGYLALRKPEKDWYGCRALAESVKTATWRYMMKAAPFNGSSGDVRSDFAIFLEDILKANSHIGEPLSKQPMGGQQITATMDLIRGSSLGDRISRYESARIEEQHEWYVSRARQNRRAFRFWISLCIAVQAIAMLLSIIRLRFDQSLSIWPMDPLLVVVSAVIAWIQIKKFNELASAYTLTGHEIGIIRAKIIHSMNESEFSDFVNEAERAFSREHTQWIARQNTI